MDKESLKKNKFWYLLGGFGLVFLILLICAMSSASEVAEKNKKDQGDKKKSLSDWANKKPKNIKFIEPWEEYRKKFEAEKNKVWADAWATQSNFYEWPVGPNTDYNKRMLYAADSTKEVTLREREEYKNIYTKQFKDLKKRVVPAVFNGDGPDSDAGYNAIMGPTMATADAPGAGGRQQNRPGNGPPGAPGMQFPPQGGAAGGGGAGFNVVLDGKEDPLTVEEIWILQEDFWVKRELLSIVQATQQSVGHFVRLPVKEKDPKPEGVPADAVVHRFSNGIWEFTLYIEKNGGRSIISDKSTITNVSPTHSVLPLAAAQGTKGLVFRLTQGATHFDLEVSGEPLPYNLPYKLASPLNKRSPDTLELTKEFDMEQEFDWSNAPVRRIDALRTAYQSHRTAKGTLVSNPIFKTEEAIAPGGQPSPSGGQPKPPGGGQQPAPTGGPQQAPGGPQGPGGPGGDTAVNVNATPYGLERSRYVMATGQARHLPIAMVLIVEPTHINDVLIAVANSPLRIQTTQVAFQRPLSPIIGPGQAKDKAVGSGMPPLSGPQPTGPGTRPTTGMGSSSDGEADSNLVELTIYGIATLYERPKPKEDKPTVPVTPMGKP